MTSLWHLFDAHGMIVVDVDHIEPHGGSLQVTIQRKAPGVTPSDKVSALLKDEEANLTEGKLDEFRSNVDTQIAAFRDLLTELQEIRR